MSARDAAEKKECMTRYEKLENNVNFVPASIGNMGSYLTNN